MFISRIYDANERCRYYWLLAWRQSHRMQITYRIFSWSFIFVSMWMNFLLFFVFRHWASHLIKYYPNHRHRCKHLLKKYELDDFEQFGVYGDFFTASADSDESEEMEEVRIYFIYFTQIFISVA